MEGGGTGGAGCEAAVLLFCRHMRRDGRKDGREEGRKGGREEGTLFV